MSDPVQIGFPELYEKLEALDKKLDAHVIDMSIRVALLEREATRRWEVRMAQAGWVVSAVIAIASWVV